MKCAAVVSLKPDSAGMKSLPPVPFSFALCFAM